VTFGERNGALSQFASQIREAQGGASDGTEGYWLQGTGDWGSVDGNKNAPGSSSNGAGVMAGYGRQMSAGVRIRAALCYGHGESSDDINAKTNWETIRITGYGGIEQERVAFGGAVSIGFDRFDSDRPIVLGSVRRVARSSHDGLEAAITGEAEYRLHA